MGPAGPSQEERRESTLTGQPFALARCHSGLRAGPVIPEEGVTTAHASSPLRPVSQSCRGRGPGGGLRRWEREDPSPGGRTGQGGERLCRVS